MAVENCDNCGVCCMGKNLRPLSGNVCDMMAAPRRRLVLSPSMREALERVLDGPLGGNDGCPCIWLHRMTGECLHYEYRPQLCRDTLQPGDETCLRLRCEAGIED